MQLYDGISGAIWRFGLDLMLKKMMQTLGDPFLLPELSDIEEQVDTLVMPALEADFNEPSLVFINAWSLGLLAPIIPHAHTALRRLLEWDDPEVQAGATLALLYNGEVPSKVNWESLIQVAKNAPRFPVVVPQNFARTILTNLIPYLETDTTLAENLLKLRQTIKMNSGGRNTGLTTEIDIAFATVGLDTAEFKILRTLLPQILFESWSDYHRKRFAIKRLLELNEGARQQLVRWLIEEESAADERRTWAALLRELPPQQTLQCIQALFELETLPRDIENELDDAIIDLAQIGETRQSIYQLISRLIQSDEAKLQYAMILFNRLDISTVPRDIWRTLFEQLEKDTSAQRYFLMVIEEHRITVAEAISFLQNVASRSKNADDRDKAKLLLKQLT